MAASEVQALKAGASSVTTGVALAAACWRAWRRCRQPVVPVRLSKVAVGAGAGVGGGQGAGFGLGASSVGISVGAVGCCWGVGRAALCYY
jgi:hypothetical protein